MGIQKPALDHIHNLLTTNLITNLAPSNPARAGVVKIGQLQETMDPDEARISITIFENDPDQFVSGVPTSLTAKNWADSVIEVEVGGAVTWRRCFTIRARCLLERTRESEDEAETIASTVRGLIEQAILGSSWDTVEDSGEYVSRTPIAYDFQGEQIKAGGPPDSFDYLIKIHFAILTTKVVRV